MREINDEFVMQFIPDTRFDEYQCCKHAVRKYFATGLTSIARNSSR